MNRLFIYLLFFLTLPPALPLMSQNIPLPEHPRPDHQRKDWINLNGYWNFEFEKSEDNTDSWSTRTDFSQRILVPFPWGSSLSGVEDNGEVGWYQRKIRVSEDWAGRRIFLVIGAADWETTVWIDGHKVGTHQGGYIPFEFDVSEWILPGESHDLVIRVDDVRRDFTLYGKQGYGNARGIWQTIYLETRGETYLDALHFAPDIDQSVVTVTAYLDRNAESDMTLELEIDGQKSVNDLSIKSGQYKGTFTIPIDQPHLWSLDDPFLYNVKAKLGDDLLSTYFGMRKISTMNLPGTDHKYIALNNKPIYLQLALDQSYHPEGFYTFPSDAFMKEEIERSKSIGLNGIRTHVKIDIPRKLYWADRLGLLVMADVPNSWGEPDKYMQRETEYHLREMIKRDYNHPSIFSWVIFNETWGLMSTVPGSENKREYLPSSQQWVASMYYLAKSLDQTRLVEDNSICCGRGHVVTDINSWHAYLPGWSWDDHLKKISDNTFPGSTHDYEVGFIQGDQPNINSECGNVWGYDGSTGDVDWSYDYHRMMNSFRKYPKIAGWLYTEHHDVINEWNGYWRFDRTDKITGLSEIVQGMSLKDLHSDVYVSTGNDICIDVDAGSQVKIPIYLSSMTDKNHGDFLTVEYSLLVTDESGEEERSNSGSFTLPYKPWTQLSYNDFTIEVPNTNGLARLALITKNKDSEIVHRNFIHLSISGAAPDQAKKIISVSPEDFHHAEWSKKHWSVMDGKKINGTGEGYFSYRINIPSGLKIGQYEHVYFRVEAAAKQLFVKDQQAFDRNQNYMRGSVVAPSSNPNSYPMTDEVTFPSVIEFSINGNVFLTKTLPDDPADHRGVLSWHNQNQDRKLHEAGSYGYMVSIPVSKKDMRTAARTGYLEIKIRAKDENGLAIFGKDFGRYPVDPCLVFVK